MYTTAIYTYRTIVYLFFVYIYIFMPICAYVYIFNIHIYPHLNPHFIHPSTWLHRLLFSRLIYDATWADPQFEEGLGPNERGGEAISFGPVTWCLGGSEVKAGLVRRFWKNKKDLVFQQKWVKRVKFGWNFGDFFFEPKMFWLPPQKSNIDTKNGHI